MRGWRHALRRSRSRGDAEAPQGLDHRGRQAREAVPVRELLSDHGIRECTRMDIPSRRPPPGPAGGLQPVPGRVLDPCDRRALRERLHLRGQGGRAFRPLKRIYSSYNLVAVHHAKNLLAVEGIRATVKNEILSSAMGELPPIECQAELWVQARDVA